MKYLAILIFIIVFPGIACSQSAKKKLAEFGRQLNIAIEKEFNPDSTVGSGFCQRGCVFVKFRFTKSKDEPEIFFSSDSAAFINRALISAIRRIRNNASLISDLKKKSQTYVLPVIYDYDGGCSIQQSSGKDSSQEDRYLYMINYYRRRASTDMYLINLVDMLRFGDRQTEALSCVLLKPITVGPITSPGY